MADVDIGTLGGAIEIVDKGSQATLNAVGKAIGDFNESWKEVGQTVLTQAAAFFTAEAALEAVETGIHAGIDAIKEMVVEGPKIADVEENFNHLADAAGRTGETLLGSLRAGTHGTIADFDLLKIANSDLAAGLNLTDDQFKLMAQGGFALAQAKGMDVQEAFENINQALLRGSDRALRMLGIHVDLAKAEDEYAKKAGLTVDTLNAQEKLEAKREGTLQALAEMTNRLGVQTDGLDEKMDQLAVRWKNFEEDLAKTVGTSPVLMAALDGIEDAITKAFGSSSADLVKDIAKFIDQAAIEVVHFGQYIVTAMQFAATEFLGFLKLVEMVQEGVQGITYSVEALLVDLARLNDFLNHTDSSPMIQALEKDMDRLYTSMAKSEAQIQSYTKAQNDVAVMSSTLSQALKSVEDRMKAAESQTKDSVKVTQELSEGEKIQAQWAAEAAAKQEALGNSTRMTKEEAKKLADAHKELDSIGKSYTDTLSKMDSALVATIKTALEAGASSQALQTVYHVTAAEVKAVEEAIKAETKAQELEAKQTADSKARWAEYHAAKVEMSGTATAKMLADQEKWYAGEVESHQKAKTDTADFYDWLDKMSTQRLQAEEQKRLQADVHSKAHFDQLAADAKDAYEFAAAHADQFTREYIEDLRETSVAAEVTARTWMEQMGGTMDKVAAKVEKVKDAIQSLEYTTSYSVEPVTQLTIDTTQGGADALLDKLAYLMQNIGTEKANVHDFASQAQYFADVAELNALKAAYDLLTSNAKRKHMMPQFSEGGIGDFGDGTIAELHGKEAVIPLERAGGLGIGGTVNIIYQNVNGTGKQVATETARELMGWMKQVRQFGSA